MRKLFSLLFIATISLCFGKIIETKNFSEIYDHIDKNTLIVLDIDDTLLVPTQMLGCDAWFCHRVKLYQELGMDKGSSLETTIAEWEAVRHITQMQLVEPGTEKIIQDLQNQGYMVMGLTTQGLALATRTSQQLADQQINLTLTAPTKEDHYFLVNHHGILFRNGILFTSGRSKAEAMEKLCTAMNLHPKKMIFVNDKKDNLQDLERYALNRGIDFTGLRYGFSDFRKEAFDKKIADYEFCNSSFDYIMSDEEAKKNLSENQ